jgi:hypothetical protein
MTAQRVALADGAGNVIAELLLTREDDGWYTGSVIAHQLPSQLKRALDWYDEAVDNQMLSYLDEATAAVEQFGLCLRHPNGSVRNVYALHIDRQERVSFRTTPVPPAACLPKSESA